ncbi:MAG: hypothetical protein IJ301_03475 [Clostridia bacterium]|nr:hypothetical protein [Clostridia bacterium]
MNKTYKNSFSMAFPILCAILIALTATLCVTSFNKSNNASAATANTLTISFYQTYGSYSYINDNDEASKNAKLVFQLSNGNSHVITYSGGTPSSFSFAGLTTGETYTLTVIAPTFATVSFRSPALTYNSITFTLPSAGMDLTCQVVLDQETWFTNTNII